MLLGNAAAPRWWDLDARRLDQYLGFLVGAGATSIELVLHHGPIDDRGARVHVREGEWLSVARKAQANGLACQFHASLDGRFELARWRRDRSGLQAEYLPILTAVRKIAENQASAAAFVVHATSSATDLNDDGAAAKGFLAWAAELAAGANLVICPELRPAHGDRDRRLDRSRAALTTFLTEFGHPQIGICWDLGHDWENGGVDNGWRPAPSAGFLDLVRHVHVHDAAADGSLHHPLGHGRVPWAEQLGVLRTRGFPGAATMEIRYRYALAAGEPWTVLAASYRRALDAVTPR